jgi:hypothetical protein
MMLFDMTHNQDWSERKLVHGFQLSHAGNDLPSRYDGNN